MKQLQDSGELEKLERYRESQRNWKRRAVVWFQEFKKTLKCAQCGFDHPGALQFHHLRDKTLNISKMVNRNRRPEEVLAEMEKCVVLCANCHAILHHEEKEAKVAAAKMDASHAQ